MDRAIDTATRISLSQPEESGPTDNLGLVWQELKRLQARCQQLERQLGSPPARLYWPGERPHVQFEIDP